MLFQDSTKGRQLKFTILQILYIFAAILYDCILEVGMFQNLAIQSIDRKISESIWNDYLHEVLDIFLVGLLLLL